LPKSALAKITEDASSGAVSFRVGDTFYGPGPLTVGWFGSKKQILVPNGPWTVLAALDQYSTHAQRISMTTVVLAKFQDGKLRGLLSTTLNSRSGPPSSRWTEMERCEAGDPEAIFEWKSASATLRQCLRGRFLANIPAIDTWKGEAWETTARNLRRLNVPVGDGQGVRTELVFTDNRSGFLRVMHYDLDSSTNSDAASSKRFTRQTATERVSWGRAYASVAASGFARLLEAEDLRAGDAVAVTGIKLPD
jgi:hypothetical protein